MHLQRGFTLLELLITILVLALVLGLGVPGFRELVLNNRQASAVNELVTALQLARSEAITQNIGTPGAVSVCPSSDGTSCSGTWSDGWIAFTDNDTSGTVNGPDTVLRAAEAPQGINIATPGFAGVISYRRDGRVLGAADFVFCDTRGGSKARVVQVGISGRPAASKVRSDGSAPNCP
jgi:type IV fimbrial biogenesis protein FimT